MSELARRTIDELRARYELEPKLKDIYVEGIFDQEIILSCLRSTNNFECLVYEIDSVEIPSELLLKYNFTNGNKQRVITLAQELSNLPDTCSFRCLVDKDLDQWFNAVILTNRLVWTEFTSIEMNFFSDDIIKEILQSTAKVNIESYSEYINSLIETLKVLYALRLADRELDLLLNWISFEKYLSKNSNKIFFNLNTYIDRVLIKNSKFAFKAEFIFVFNKWLDNLEGDCRHFIRGHDFVEILAWTIDKYKGIKNFTSPLAIERLFVLVTHYRSIFEISNLLNDI